MLACACRSGWNLFCQEGAAALLECQRQGIKVHCAGIFRYIYNGASAEELAAGTDPFATTRQAWSRLCEQHGVSLAAAAISFAALLPCVDKVVMGFSLPEEVGPTLAAAGEVVPPALWHDAQAEGLLVPELRLPPA